ncbi:sulfite exporter TauE/SafE family protein [Comamonas aquatica]|jgi:sulfite exporter TauE/SafE|uniref:sulfite exporter TauE/SafE family protein n=1 Tax=Comamonas aquatica TaxID=225991 RepID=UPI003D036E13
MALSLLWTAFFMGLVGGPHCLAMCAAPCHAVIQGQAHAVRLHAGAAVASSRGMPGWAALQFHTGRLLGYGMLGAVAALAMEQMAWFSDRTSLLHPVWVLMHLLILAWGLLMVFQGQQPAWLERAGRAAWGKVQPVLALPGGGLLAGIAWALMPCGLLYSAVLVAALSGGAVAGAGSMVAFAVGGGLWLWSAPYAWRWLSGRVRRWRAEWGTRVAGLMLVAVSLWALWMDLIFTPAMWCR